MSSALEKFSNILRDDDGSQTLYVDNENARPSFEGEIQDAYCRLSDRRSSSVLGRHLGSVESEQDRV